jgi:hypothetical protein
MSNSNKLITFYICKESCPKISSEKVNFEWKCFMERNENHLVSKFYLKKIIWLESALLYYESETMNSNP